MAARKRVRGARPAAGAAAGRKGTTAAAKLQRQQRKIELVFGKDAADRIAAATGVKVILDGLEAVGFGHLADGLRRREAEASVALDNDPSASTYSLERCGTCGLKGTAGVQVVHTTCAGPPGMWHCNRGFGCMTPEVQAALDAISAAGLDDPLPLEVSAKGKLALGNALSSTHPCTGSGCMHPLCERADRCTTDSEGRGRAPASTPPADLGGVRRETRAEYMDRVSKMDPLQRLGLAGTAVPRFRDEPLIDAGVVEVPLDPPRFDPLRSYSPPPSMHALKPGLYLDVDLNAAPPVTAPSLDAPCTHPARQGKGHEVYTDGEYDIAGAPVLRVLLGATREQAEAQVAKLEQILLGPEARTEPALDELHLQLANAQQTARNMAERFRLLGMPMCDPELDALLQLVVGRHPAGEVIRGLGVDPGYAHLGFVVVDFGPSFLRVVHREKLDTDTDDDDETRLNRIARKLDALVYQLAPHFVAYENVAAVHAGIAQLAKAGKPGRRGDNAGARRQLEVCGMIRSSTQRYGCAGYTVMPGSARRGVLGKGNTKGATKKTVREAVERILGVRGLSLELSDAAAIVLAGYGKHREATLKGRRRRR